MNESGIGTRVLSFVIDTILIAIATWGFFRWSSFYALHWNYRFLPYYQVFFATVFVYYSLFEILFNRTPGKYFSLSKVIDEKGGKPKWWQIVLRSLLRLTLIDAFFIPIINRPLHDAWSKTRVVEV